MAKSDIARGGWSTDLVTGTPSVSDILYVGVGMALLMFAFGLTMTAPPVDAAIVGLLYGTVIVGTLVAIASLTAVMSWFRRRA